MEIKTTYIAFDGKEFDDENLCAEYEYQKKYYTSLSMAHFYDYRGREKPLSTVITNEANLIFMAYLPSKEAVKTFRKIWAEQGLIGTDGMIEPGFYFYEDDKCDDKELWHMVDSFPEYIANQYHSYTIAKRVKEQFDNEN